MGFKNTPALGPISYDPEAYHVTLLGRFDLPVLQRESFLTDCSGLVEGVAPFSLTFAGWAYFSETPVLLTVGGGLQSLHESLVSLVEKRGGVFFEPGFIGKNFKPHVSHLTDIEQLWEVNSLSLVEHGLDFGIDVRNVANFYFE